MRNWLRGVSAFSLMALLALCLCTEPTIAWPRRRSKPVKSTEEIERENKKKAAENKRKQMLAMDVNVLTTRGTRVGVLRQLLNEEIANLNKMQDIFCKKYSLDVKKFKEGKYLFMNDTGKIIERQEKSGGK